MKVLASFLLFAPFLGFGQTFPFFDGFESADSTCWAARPNGDANDKGCGYFKGIGKDAAIGLLPHSKINHTCDGHSVVEVRSPFTEAEARAHVNINGDHVFVRFYTYFPASHDTTKGMKILRIQSYDSTHGGNYLDYIMSRQQGGQTVNFERNGGSQFGWANYRWQHNRWYEVQAELQLNHSGAKDGIARLWINDTLVIDASGIDTREGVSNRNITFVTFGGWGYANGPYYLDDVAVSRQKIPSLGACQASTTPHDTTYTVSVDTTLFEIITTTRVTQRDFMPNDTAITRDTIRMM